MWFSTGGVLAPAPCQQRQPPQWVRSVVFLWERASRWPKRDAMLVLAAFPQGKAFLFLRSFEMNYFVRFESLQEWAERHTAVKPLLTMPRRILDQIEITDEMLEQLTSGVEHPNPRVRFECAHLADHIDDERCFEILFRLCQDDVPRVRAEALHGLACEQCKSCPLPGGSVAILVEAALHDLSGKVRDKMVMTFASHSPDARISEALQYMAEHESNLQIRQKALQALKQHAVTT